MSKQIKRFIPLVVILPLLVYGCKNKNNNSINSESIIDSSIQATDPLQNEIGLNNNNSINNSESNNQAEKNIIVNLKKSDEIFQKQYCSSIEDIELNRPSTINGSEVFYGWAEQRIVEQIIDNNLNDGDNISLTVETINIGAIENAIYNDTVYTNSESEYVEIPVVIGGNTNFSILDLEISFDTNIFTFDSFTYTDEEAICNYDNSKILISFVSTSNVKSDVNLCNLKLKKNNLSQNIETELEYKVKDIAAWNSSSTDYINVSHKIVNDKIVMY